MEVGNISANLKKDIKGLKIGFLSQFNDNLVKFI